ncbi:MAG: thioredoxin fold domain-containing protein [Planctomycetaceae bacterium]|nr:thioredoxin fold domain-containing protein [Planctomycetaceae bacterium]
MTIVALLLAMIASPSADAAGEPTLLDFHAAWCGPCQQMRPAVEQLIQKGYQVKSIDIDHSPELAERYHVTQVPTFIVVDPSGKPLARSMGAQPAAQLARLYLATKAKINPPAAPRARATSEEGDASREDEADDHDHGHDEAEDRPAPAPVNPKPWETVVRIKVHGEGSIGFGSGTIISSTPEESIILTCAHIFKLEGRQQVRPEHFPRKITIDLFDGKLVGQRPAMVHYANDSYEGEVIDYDFDRDVGLIRIRPGRRLPASRVVPATWMPKERMAMLTVGCSEGHDATAWNTMIINPSMRGLVGNSVYEAVACTNAPKQGRSGGGLFTTDGYLAGVCDFAEPRGDHGLYASPRSMHAILDRNNLMALYAPAKRRSEALLAQNPSNPERTKPPSIARAQSPDRDEPVSGTIPPPPPPEDLGIKVPRLVERGPKAVPASAMTRRDSWHASTRPAPDLADDAGSAAMTDLKLPPAADNDRFAAIPDADPAEESEEAKAAHTSRPTASKWRPVKSSPDPLTVATPP